MRQNTVKIHVFVASEALYLKLENCILFTCIRRFCRQSKYENKKSAKAIYMRVLQHRHRNQKNCKHENATAERVRKKSETPKI